MYQLIETFERVKQSNLLRSTDLNVSVDPPVLSIAGGWAL